MTSAMLFIGACLLGFVTVVMVLNWLFIYVSAKVLKAALKDKEGNK